VNFEKTSEIIKNIFKSKLSVTPKVVVVSVGTLPRSEKKTKRVFDHRDD
jgi:phenylacetate-CoA ligase